MHLKLENFDGPLDVLLHLIKAQELNIFNIPIAIITEQYLSFLKQVTQLDFHTAGEYLTMAAQLIEIKANLLLPVLQQKEIQNPENIEEIKEDDPRKILVEQLIEFEALQNASSVFATLHEKAAHVFSSGECKRRQDEFLAFEHPLRGNALDLIIVLERLLLRHNKSLANKVIVKAQKITIQEKMEAIKKKLKDIEVLTLTDLLENCESRYEFIVVIMAILELCKANHLNVFQPMAFAEIELSKGKFFEQNNLSLSEL
jgi:segregation and condensation protein A